MVLLADKVAKGYYTCRDSMNNMIDSSEKNLENAISTLKDFTAHEHSIKMH